MMWSQIIHWIGGGVAVSALAQMNCQRCQLMSGTNKKLFTWQLNTGFLCYFRANDLKEIQNSPGAGSNGATGGSRKSNSRPSSVIERFHIEAGDDGGGTGITIGGVFLSSNCNIILVVMASIFMVVGIILTAISYRGRETKEAIEEFNTRREWSSQLRIAGPIFMLIGLAMLTIGLVFCCLAYKVSKGHQNASSYSNNEYRPFSMVKPFWLSSQQTYGNNRWFFSWTNHLCLRSHMLC